MERYANINNDSGVMGYEIGDDFITVKFNTGAIYIYTYSSAGRENVETMKALAMSGNGLNSFINKHAKHLYA